MNRGVSAILEALANPIRGQVVLSLQKSAVSKYSDLLQACGLDPYSESGKLGYHLQQLISVGLVARDGSTYALTEKGKKASKLMTTVNETSRELFALPDSHAGKPVRKEKIRLREATYSDIGGIVKLWRASLPTDEQPDYFVAELIAGREGIKKQALLHEGSGLGRSTFVAEYDGEIIGCCILDLISLAHMKTEYLANMDPGKLPKELQLSLTEQEEEFHRRYWEAQSKLIATLSSTDYMETKYGVTGISTVGGEPIKLVFTRKSFEGEEFVTADLEEILEEMLWCKKVSTHALNTLREEMEAMGFGGPPACFEIFHFILHPGFDRQEVGEVILGYVEDQAASRGMTYIVASEEPDYLESREFYRTNGYTDLHQPSFEYKHAGRKETCLLIKKLPRGEA